MNRRAVFSLFGVFLATTLPAIAQGDHDTHKHAAATTSPPVNKKLIDTSSDCIKTGQACIAHCFDAFAAGDTSLAACARSVDQMMSVCGALQKLASAGSPNLPGLAKIALAICDDCERECRKHAEHHATCKACADACKNCAEACRSA